MPFCTSNKETGTVIFREYDRKYSSYVYNTVIQQPDPLSFILYISSAK